MLINDDDCSVIYGYQLKTGQNSRGSFSYRSHAERGNDVLFTLSCLKLVAYFIRNYSDLNYLGCSVFFGVKTRKNRQKCHFSVIFTQ